MGIRKPRLYLQPAEELLRRFTCFMLGVSVALLAALMNFESYVLMRFGGQGNLASQGLWYFLKRMNYLTTIFTLFIFIYTKLKRYSVILFEWALSGSYVLTSIYVCVFPDPFKYKWILVLFFLSASICSTLVLAGFLVYVFNMEKHRNLNNSLVCIFLFLLGTCIATYIPRILLAKSIMARVLHLGKELGMYAMIRFIIPLFAIITFFTACLMWLSSVGEWISFYHHYLRNYKGCPMRLPRDISVICLVLLCALGWALSHMSGFATSTFIFSLPLSAGIWIMNLQSCIFMAITSFFVVYYVYRKKQVTGTKEEIEDDFGAEASCYFNDKGKDTCGSSKKAIGNSDRMTSALKSPAFRQPQPWYMLPVGFWSVWENDDNDLFACLFQCKNICDLISLIRSDDVSEYSGCYNRKPSDSITTDDIANAKHQLLGAVASLVTKCDSTLKTQKETLLTSVLTKCPIKTVGDKLKCFLEKCKCTKKTWTKKECNECVYVSDDKTTAAVGCSSIGSANAVKTSHHMKVTVSFIGKLIDDCMFFATQLVSNIRNSSIFMCDIDDISLADVADILEEYLLEYLALSVHVCLIEEWILLHMCMPTLEKEMQSIIEYYSEMCKCTLKDGDVECPDDSVCACVCLMWLMKCFSLLHDKQCAIAYYIQKDILTGQTTVLTLSHTRCLMMLCYGYTRLMDSDMASDIGNCGCSKSKTDACKCGCYKYCKRLYDLLSRWFDDASSDMCLGDALLSETIELLSHVLSDNDDKFDTLSESINILQVFGKMTRTLHSQLLKLTKYQLLTRSVDSMNSECLVDLQAHNFCLCCSNIQGSTKGGCIDKDIKECSVTYESCMSIIKCIDLLKTCNIEDVVTKCMDKMESDIKTLSEKLLRVCNATKGKVERLCQLGCDIKKVFEGFINKSLCTQLTITCKQKAKNGALGDLLFYKCSLTKSGEGSSCSLADPQLCSQRNCKSFVCVMYNITTTISGKNNCGELKCSSCSERDTPCECTQSFACLLTECCKNVSELEKVYCNDGELCCKLGQLCCHIDTVTQQLQDIDKCLQDLYCDYNCCCVQVMEANDQIKGCFESQRKCVCCLQRYLDEKCTTYNKALKSLSCILEATTKLSNQNQAETVKLENYTTKVVNATNETLDRLKTMDSNLEKCMEGLVAEKRNSLVPAKLEITSNKHRENTVMLSLSDLMRIFDFIWLAAVVLCLLYSWFSAPREDWLSSTSIIFTVLVAVKGAVTLNGYMFGLARCRKSRENLIFLSIIIGFIISLCMSWVSQWWTHAIYLREHSIPVVEWFRFINPNYVYGHIGDFYQWSNGMLSIILADLQYLCRFLFGGNYAHYYYNPFGSVFDGYFHLHSRPINFAGICDWTLFEKHIRTEVVKTAEGGDLNGLLDYIAFTGVSPWELDFLFGIPVANIERFPFDLLWVAWNLREILTAERCLAYSIVESAYIQAHIGIKTLIVNNKENEAILLTLLEKFLKQQRNKIAEKAMWVPNVANVNIRGHQMESLMDVFQNHFKQEWNDVYLAKLLETGSYESAGTSTSVSKVDPSEFPSESDIRHSLEDWINSRMSLCSTMYGDSDLCRLMVTSAADMLLKYLLTVTDKINSKFPKLFLKFCEKYRNNRLYRYMWDDQYKTETKTVEKDGTVVEPFADGHEDGYFDGEFIYPDDGSHNIDNYRTTGVTQCPNRYILGYWLKCAAVDMNLADVKSALHAMYSYNRSS